MSLTDQAVENLLITIRQTPEFAAYQTALKQIKQFPGLKERLDEYRQQSYGIQSSPDMEFWQIDRFEESYADFKENPFVADFLTAELDFCRLMQSINMQLTEGVDFE